MLEREYVYANPPISLTELAEKHGLARSNVADKARIGKWFEKREELQRKINDGVREALAEQWVAAETAFREKLLKAGGTYLDRYVTALDAEDSKITVNTKDMLGIAAMMRTIMADVKNDGRADAVIVTPDGEVKFADMDEAKKAMADLQKLIGSGEEPETDDDA